MDFQQKLKEAGVNIHVIATGAGAGIQERLWSIPGSSAYFSGASFPYSPEEQQEILGFMPEHFSSKENAVDLASAAYMKAYQFGGKKPIGIGLAASVASEYEHRGDHRVDLCIISDDKILTYHYILIKDKGAKARERDGESCDDLALYMLQDIIDSESHNVPHADDGTTFARERFFKRPYFTAEGKRHHDSVVHILNTERFVLMPGAFNPPHKGHYGASDHMDSEYHRRAIFEITSDPPHKDALSVQDMLKRAKLLQGYDRLITQGMPYYLHKANAFPGMGIYLGADAMVRLLDPKWGLNALQMFKDFDELGTTLYIGGRDIDGKFITHRDIGLSLPYDQAIAYWKISKPVGGEWHISSTEIRNKLL